MKASRALLAVSNRLGKILVCDQRSCDLRREVILILNIRPRPGTKFNSVFGARVAALLRKHPTVMALGAFAEHARLRIRRTLLLKLPGKRPRMRRFPRAMLKPGGGRCDSW